MYFIGKTPNSNRVSVPDHFTTHPWLPGVVPQKTTGPKETKLHVAKKSGPSYIRGTKYKSSV